MSEIKKLSLKRETVKNLTVKTDLKAGKTTAITCTCAPSNPSAITTAITCTCNSETLTRSL